MLKAFAIAVALLGLAACYPSNATHNGLVCHPEGYSWRPYMIDPNGKPC